MANTLKNRARGTQRPALALLYVIVTMTVMFGFCSLAIDLGRVQTAKTEMERAAQAAARAAVANLTAGTTAADNAAVSMAAANLADGSSVTISAATDVQFLNWVSKSNHTVVGSAVGANAVRVYVRRTAALGNAVPLLFAQVLGIKTCDVTVYATARITTQSSTQFVAATSNPWLAGQTATGVTASQPDPGYFNPGAGQNPTHLWQYDLSGPAGGHAAGGEGYESPLQVTIPVNPGTVISVSNVSGLSSNDATRAPAYNAQGFNNGSLHIYSDDGANPTMAQSSVTTLGSEHGISNIATPINSMVGVFLNDNVPDTEGTVPAGLDFSTQTARDYSSISPDLRQAFYAGDGQTSGGQQQQIVVPQGATRMFLGTMDGHEWSNNAGGFTATFTVTQISLVE